MLKNVNLASLVMSNLGYAEPLSNKDMLLNFMMCRDDHALCNKNFYEVVDHITNKFGQDGRSLFYDVVLLSWLVGVSNTDRLQWGISFKDDKLSLIPFPDACMLDTFSSPYYTVKGMTVQPTMMFYPVQDWYYISKAFDLYKTLETALSNSSWLFGDAGADVPFVQLVDIYNFLEDRKHELDRLFLNDVANSDDFKDWLATEYNMSDSCIKSMIEMQDSNKCCMSALYGKLELYVKHKAEVSHVHI